MTEKSSQTIISGLQSGSLVGENFIVTITNPTEFVGQITHSVHQITRMANLLDQQKIRGEPVSEERIMQLGLNLGRLQEMCASIGGVEFWWRRFKPHVGNWSAMKQEGLLFCDDIGIGRPSEDFLKRE